jgi:hypothetical protein
MADAAVARATTVSRRRLIAGAARDFEQPISKRDQISSSFREANDI